MKNLPLISAQGTALSLMAIGMALSALPMHAQTVSEELATGAKNGCIRVAEAKGFQVKEVTSVQPVGTDGAKAVLSLTRNGQLFKLTCGYTHKTGAALDKNQSSSTTASNTNPATTGTPTDTANSTGAPNADSGTSAANAARTAVMAETMGTDTAAKTDTTQADAAKTGEATVSQANPAKIETAKPETTKLDGSKGSSITVAPTDLTPLWWLLLPLLGLPLLLWLMKGRQDRMGYGGRSDAIVHGDGNAVEIHANPGTHHPQIGTLYDGQRVTLSGRYHEKWSELADGGWIPSQYLEPLLDNASRYVTR